MYAFHILELDILFQRFFNRLEETIIYNAFRIRAMGYQEPPSGRIKTAQRVFDVLELAREAEEDGVTLSEVTSELDTAKSTAHRYLATLEGLGYLVRDGEQFYLGSTFLQYGTAARNRPG